MRSGKIAARLLILATPLIAWQAVELFLFPIDALNFRFWEALRVYKVFLLPGPFYPNATLGKFEAGDRYPRMPRTKLINFQSDEFGQRNPPGRKDLYDVVILGDSNIAGSHIDEPNTIRARLAAECRCNVYAYTGSRYDHMQQYLEDRHFKKHPPRWVILELRPGDVEQSNFSPYVPCPEKTYQDQSMIGRVCGSKPFDPDIVANSRLLSLISLRDDHAVLSYIDRLYKQPSYHYFHARLRLTTKAGLTPLAEAGDDREAIQQSRRALTSYRDAVNARGSEFLLFLMPNQPVGEGRPSSWLTDFRKDSLNIISIDSSSIPTEILRRWWMDDDSHWREENIAFSARLLSKELGRLPNSELPVAPTSTH